MAKLELSLKDHDLILRERGFPGLDLLSILLQPEHEVIYRLFEGRQCKAWAREAQDNVEKIDGMSVFLKGILTHKDFVIFNLSPIKNHAI